MELIERVASDKMCGVPAQSRVTFTKLLLCAGVKNSGNVVTKARLWAKGFRLIHVTGMY